MKKLLFLASVIVLISTGCAVTTTWKTSTKSEKNQSKLTRTFNGFEFVVIEGGPFQAGIDGTCCFEEGGCEKSTFGEEDVHEVDVPSFFMSLAEVTNAQYRTFCDATGHSYPPAPKYHKVLGGNYFLDYPDHPVFGVSYENAEECARWYGFRLPTFYEFEKCCKSGKGLVQYPWGSYKSMRKLHDIANHANLSGSRRKDKLHGPTRVKSYPANDYGVYDICGNVDEWVSGYPEQNRKSMVKHFRRFFMEQIAYYRGGAYHT